MVRSLRSTALALLALLAATTLWADAQGRLQATVVDENGNPLADVAVLITSEEIGYRKELTTDKKGRLSVIFVDATRSYVLHFKKDGYQAVERAFKPALGENLRETFTVPKVGAATAAPAQPQIDARNPAINLFNEGVTALQAGDMATAEAKFTEASEKDPSLPDPYSALAGIHLERKEYSQAVAMAQKVLAIDPVNQRALQTQYDSYRGLGDAANANRVLAELKKAGGTGTDTAVRVFNLGAEAARLGDLKVAAERFREAIEIDPELAPAHAALARVLFSQKNWAETIAAADTALAIDPGIVNLLKFKYEAHRQLGDEAKAREVFAEMAQQDPAGTAKALFDSGVAMFNAGNIEGATAAFQQALDAQPDHPKAHYMLGLCYANRGDTAKAKEHLARFLELAPQDPDAELARDMVKSFG